MRTASQILARHCPVPRPVHESDDEGADYEYYVPMKDAIAAIKEATGEEQPQPNLSPLEALAEFLLIILTSPLTFVFAGVGAVMDRFEMVVARTKMRTVD